MIKPKPKEATSGTAPRHVPLVILGAVLALAVPMASAAVAALWSSGWIDPDPNGGIVAALQSIGFPSLALSPVGLVLVAWAAGVRSALAWTGVLLWGLPGLAVLWFVYVAWLSGLAGERLLTGARPYRSRQHPHAPIRARDQ